MSATTTNPPWVLVTGGSRGIGKGLVQKLLENGYSVIFTYQHSAAEAQALTAEQTNKEVFCEAHQCDGRQYQQVKRLCDFLVEQYGPPWALINNMGITQDALIHRFDIQRYHDVIASNLDSSIYFSQCLAPLICENQAGAIVQISSVSGIKGNPGQTSYAATKAALIGMTKTLALELARFNVRVNAVLPGFIATEMVEAIPDQAKKRLIKTIPLKRMGKVEEVAELVCFLIGPQAEYITGQALVIDGGLCA